MDYTEDNINKIIHTNDEFIGLKVNGRIFQSWILKHFKKYKLPEIIRSKYEDPCSITSKIGLKLYQDFLGKYLNYNSPFKDILIYHGLGTGKTVTAINIYNVLCETTTEWNVFILIKASLQDDPWMKELKDWLAIDNPERKETQMLNIHFIHYDSPFADRDLNEVLKKVDNKKKSIFIIDEAHNFIRNVLSNIESKKGKRAKFIYDQILKMKKEDESTRVIAISGTPFINDPYELALLLNLLRADIFPKNKEEFNQIYIDNTTNSINQNNKNMFQRRILGLISYYSGETTDAFAEKIINSVDLEMSPYHTDIYQHYEDMESHSKTKGTESGDIFVHIHDKHVILFFLK